METKDAVADIIVVGNFYLVEENDIFSSVELPTVVPLPTMALPRMKALTDRRIPIMMQDRDSAVKNSCALCHPDIFTSLLEPVGRKCGTDLADGNCDQRKNLPCIGGLCEQLQPVSFDRTLSFVTRPLHIVLLFITSGYELSLLYCSGSLFPVLFHFPFPSFISAAGGRSLNGSSLRKIFLRIQCRILLILGDQELVKVRFLDILVLHDKAAEFSGILIVITSRPPPVSPSLMAVRRDPEAV